MTLRRSAQKARPHKNHGDAAWWYENAKSIDVYIRDKAAGKTLVARINRQLLKDWLERTEEQR